MHCTQHDRGGIGHTGITGNTRFTDCTGSTCGTFKDLLVRSRIRNLQHSSVYERRGGRIDAADL